MIDRQRFVVHMWGRVFVAWLLVVLVAGFAIGTVYCYWNTARGCS